MTEIVGPLNQSVQIGAKVWVRWNNQVYQGTLVGPGEHDYEVVVRLPSGDEHTVHRYNVQPS